MANSKNDCGYQYSFKNWIFAKQLKTPTYPDGNKKKKIVFYYTTLLSAHKILRVCVGVCVSGI